MADDWITITEEDEWETIEGDWETMPETPIAKEKPIGFGEAFIEDPLQKIPFSPVAVVKTAKILESAKRLQSFDYALTEEALIEKYPRAFPASRERIGRNIKRLYEDDVASVTKYLENQAEKAKRGYTLWGRVGQITSAMPAFMLEFLATGGIKKLGSETAKKYGAKAVGQFMAGTAARAVAMPHRGAEAILRRRLPRDIAVDDATGQVTLTGPKESQWTSLWKGLVDHYIEIASEEAGEYMAPVIGKVFKRLPFGGKFMGALQRAWLKIRPKGTAATFMKEISTRAGFHGVLAEIGEEDIGWISRAIFDIEDFGAGDDANVGQRLLAGLKQDIENLPAEAIAFSIPGAARTLPGMIAREAAPIVPEPKGPVIEEYPIEKPELIIGGIETETIEETINKFPQKITDGKSLAQVGNAIAEELGIDPRSIMWEYSKQKVKRMRGTQTTYPNGSHKIRLNAGHRAYQGPEGQRQMKETIVHELGHIAAPTTTSPSGIRRSVHHRAFKEWLAANRKVLDSVTTVRHIPISEVSQIPPATEVADKHVDPQTESDRLAELSRVNEEMDALVLRGEKPSEELLAKKQKLIKLLKKEVKPKARKRMAKKKTLTLGHNIPDRLGWTKEQRYEFNEKITGVKSMKRMTPAQREQVAVALIREANNAGIVIDAPESNNLDELLLKLEERKQKPALTQRDRRNMTKLRKVLHLIKSKGSLYFLHMSRMKRLCRALDNYEDNGPFTKYIFEPVKEADTKAKVNFTMTMEAGMATFNELGIDVPAMFSEVKDIGIKDKLSTAERIGVWALAQNKKTLRHLTSEFSPLEIEKITKSVEANDKETEVGLAIQVYFEQGWSQLQRIAAAHGVKGIVKEKNYITAFVKPTDDVVDAEFMEGLMTTFTQGEFVPGQQHVIARKRGAKRNLELNVFMIHARAARSIERFKVMAPVADEVGNVLKHGRFKEAINNATYGHGAKLFQKWLQDSIRGHAAYDPGPFAPALRWLRMRSVHYVLGFKVLTAAKQGISLWPAMSVHPGMIPLVFANLAHNPYSSTFKAMRAEVLSKSEMVRTRDWNRDLRQVYNQKTVQRMYAGKKLSPVLMRMATAVDSYTVTVAWNAAYRLSLKHGMNEVDSVRFADGVVQNTQPMGSAVDLPAFFRGGELERNLTIFQNQVNQNGNMFWYDILGETKARKISLRRTGYRLLMQQVIPALLLGLVSRGRLPRDLGEIGKDMAFYLLSPFTVAGRLIYNMAIAREWGPTSGFLFETPVTETYRAVGAIMKGDVGETTKYGARAIGAWSGGYPPLQVVQTTEGAWNLATGETDDFRELIWSKYALGKKKGEKRGTKTGRGF